MLLLLLLLLLLLNYCYYYCYFDNNSTSLTQGWIQGEGAGGAHPPGMTCGRFLINTVQSLDRPTKSALSFDMYSQQFTLCYFLVKSPLIRIRS